MPHAETECGRLFYTLKKGPEGAPELLLIHGAGGSRLHWPPELRRMPCATVYTLDLPGHGRSEGSACRSIERYARAVVGLLDSLGLSSLEIVGHSMGGAIAQQLAVEHPRLVSSLALVSTGARLRVAPSILTNIEEDFDAAVDLITERAWSSGADSSLKQLGPRSLRDAGRDVVLRDFTACDRFDLMQRLDEIQVPMLAIVGTEDELTPVKYSRFLSERVVDGRLVLIEDAGHMVMLERPRRVGDAIRAFTMANA